MRMRRMGSLARWAFWGIAVIATIAGWLQFLWPPVAYYLKTQPHPGGMEILGELVKPNNVIYEVPFLGWVFLALSTIIVLFLVHWTRGVADYLQHSRVGISILDTQIDVEMQDAARTKAITTRRQTLHANRRGITAYRFGSSTDSPTGRIAGPAVDQRSHVGNKLITKELLARGSPRAIDVIEVFDRELPTSLLATYLPNLAVCALHSIGLFADVVVTRIGRVTYENEFDGPEAVYSIASTKYPISRTSIRVAFLTGHEPPAGQIRSFLIRENVVEEVDLIVSHNATHTIYEAKAGSMMLESLRIQWRY